ncbi:hypothetical protein RhiirC2_803832, partial [Rhizophagus irregularis]
MNSDNNIANDYSNLPMDQTGNDFVPSIIKNFENASNSNTNLDISHINNTNTIVPTPQNNTFEFYLPLPNDT